ncbi:MAG: hypothetical protein L0G70_04110 [Rubrobacter sp.]|nr:hypothetical protein [Rubrobacter sp.]
MLPRTPKQMLAYESVSAVLEAANHLLEKSFLVGAGGKAIHDYPETVGVGVVPRVDLWEKIEPFGLHGYNV